MTIEIQNGAVASLEFHILNAWSLGSADATIAKIGQELIGDGLTIVRSDVGFSGIAFPLTGEFSATVQILNQSGQELDDTDLVSQFTDAVNAIGAQLSSAGVTQLVGTGTGQNSPGSPGNVITTPTGQAGGDGGAGSGNNPPACGDPNLSFFKNPQQYISCLTSKGLSTIGLLAIGLLIGVVLIVVAERRPTPV